MHTCKLLSRKCFFGLQSSFLRKPGKYVNFQKLNFYIFIEKFELKRITFENNNRIEQISSVFCVTLMRSNSIPSAKGKRLSMLTNKAFCDVFSWYQFTDKETFIDEVIKIQIC